MKYIPLWFMNTLIISIILFYLVSGISNTSFVNVLSEFEIILNLIGFSSIISTNIICTIILVKK